MRPPATSKRGRRVPAALIVSATALALTGCGKQSTLDPHSTQSHDIRTLWWWMLVVAGIVFLGALAMLTIAWIRRREPGLPVFGQNEQAVVGDRWIFRPHG